MILQVLHQCHSSSKCVGFFKSLKAKLESCFYIFPSSCNCGIYIFTAHLRQHSFENSTRQVADRHSPLMEFLP
ncbi:hypothetical protein ACJIZ3_019831 [Penstemon smallii]|uniref:Uncharacterized protein n=1 Tax=Penstemon smallii TaxID=265156 RepID=A0ABD3T2A1_9LAMI